MDVSMASQREIQAPASILSLPDKMLLLLGKNISIFYSLVSVVLVMPNFTLKRLNNTNNKAATEAKNKHIVVFIGIDRSATFIVGPAVLRDLIKHPSSCQNCLVLFANLSWIYSRATLKSLVLVCRKFQNNFRLLLYQKLKCIADELCENCLLFTSSMSRTLRSNFATQSKYEFLYL